MNILVLTDNLKIYEGIKAIFCEKTIKMDLNVKYFCSSNDSPIQIHSDFSKFIKVLSVNDEIEYILANFDLIISGHCTQFFPEKLVNSIRCINIHPGYNPINRGWYPQVFSIINNHSIGATIHEMDDKLDHGGIIVREFIDKNIEDTSLDIYNRVVEKELSLFNKYFEEIILNTYSLIEPEGKGNFYSKKDFTALCELKLTEVGTFLSFYNKLRALSHGDYKNAYFYLTRERKYI